MVPAAEGRAGAAGAGFDATAVELRNGIVDILAANGLALAESLADAHNGQCTVGRKRSFVHEGRDVSEARVLLEGA